jgi:PilZ domain
MSVEAADLQSNILELRGKLTDVPAKGIERRRYPRIDLNLSAYVNVAERSFCARCLSLSAGGALLRLDASLDLPEAFLLHLVMPVLGDLPVPMIARRIEVLSRRVRLAFDPLPGPLAKAVASQLLAKARLGGKLAS